jgi:hypothetical protein
MPVKGHDFGFYSDLFHRFPRDRGSHRLAGVDDALDRLK